jgi:hypothetical protein
MRFEVGVRFARAGLIAVLGISMVAGLSWGFGGVGVGVGAGRGAGLGVGGGRGGGGGIGLGRSGGDSGAKSANRDQGDSAQTDFLRERASLEMWIGPRRPERGIEDALRWDKAHRGWWSFLDSKVRANGRPAAGSEVGGRKTGRKGQEGNEFGALSKGG